MFSFHKPKVYRSTAGCCICKAKSSSSRFTDSKRYENDFIDCFNLKETRIGEICNACVLLVKRWKKLPKGTERHWNHVVDARAGPGTKSLSKNKKMRKTINTNTVSHEKIIRDTLNKKHRYIRKGIRDSSPSGLSDDILIGYEDLSLPGSLAPSPSPYPSPDMSDDEDHMVPVVASASVSKSRKQSGPTKFSGFVNLAYWRQENVCCGLVFRGQSGEVLIDPRFFTPCSCRPKSDAMLTTLAEAGEGVPTPGSTPAASSCAGSNFGDDDLDFHDESEDDDNEDYLSSGVNSPAMAESSSQMMMTHETFTEKIMEEQMMSVDPAPLTDLLPSKS